MMSKYLSSDHKADELTVSQASEVSYLTQADWAGACN